jgi:hypothetical protein
VKRIKNPYIPCGRITNPPERVFMDSL